MRQSKLKKKDDNVDKNGIGTTRRKKELQLEKKYLNEMTQVKQHPTGKHIENGVISNANQPPPHQRTSNFSRSSFFFGYLF